MARTYDKEDTFDLAQALYWYCADNHGGQWSDLYSILSQVSAIYKPGAMERGPAYEREQLCEGVSTVA